MDSNAATVDEPTLYRTLRDEKQRWRGALETIAKRPCEVFPDSTCNQQRAKRRCNSCIARSALHG